MPSVHCTLSHPGSRCTLITLVMITIHFISKYPSKTFFKFTEDCRLLGSLSGIALIDIYKITEARFNWFRRIAQFLINFSGQRIVCRLDVRIKLFNISCSRNDASYSRVLEAPNGVREKMPSTYQANARVVIVTFSLSAIALILSKASVISFSHPGPP